LVRDRAYPVLKAWSVLPNFPNLRKAPTANTPASRQQQRISLGRPRPGRGDCRDARLLPATIRASEILGLDAKCAGLRELLGNLPRWLQLPIRRLEGSRSAPAHWIRALPDRARQRKWTPDQNTMPIWFFDLCTLENPDARPGRRPIELSTAIFRMGSARTRVGVLSKLAVTAA